MTSVLYIALEKQTNKQTNKRYEVLATYGHVRKLPSRAEAVRPAENFAMDFEEVVRTGRAVKAATPLRDIQRALASASELFLATDPDREGEAIAWHVTESLQREIGARPVYRVTFTEVGLSSLLPVRTFFLVFYFSR